MTTLLLNFIILIFLQMMLEGPLQGPDEPGLAAIARRCLDQGMLPPSDGADAGAFGAYTWLWFCAGVAQFMLARSVWGFKLRAVGENAAAARKHAGINVKRSLFGVAVIVSGGLAGLAGVSEVAGLKGYLTADLSARALAIPGLWWRCWRDCRPSGVVVAALFIASRVCRG